jgi:hypothetical protein
MTNYSDTKVTLLENTSCEPFQWKAEPFSLAARISELTERMASEKSRVSSTLYLDKRWLALIQQNALRLQALRSKANKHEDRLASVVGCKGRQTEVWNGRENRVLRCQTHYLLRRWTCGCCCPRASHPRSTCGSPIIPKRSENHNFPAHKPPDRCRQATTEAQRARILLLIRIYTAVVFTVAANEGQGGAEHGPQLNLLQIKSETQILRCFVRTDMFNVSLSFQSLCCQ